MARKVTLTDVSEAAGVGIATVSRALGDHPDVSAATRERVREIAQQLGYRPSVAARALRRGGFHAISIVIPDDAWGWWEPVVVGAFQAASEHDYRVLVHPIAGTEGGVAGVVESLQNVPTEGVIVVSGSDQHAVKKACARIGIPGVAIDDMNYDVELPTVSAANREGARHAVEHLITLGRTRIAHLRVPSDGFGDIGIGDRCLVEREQGYRDALTDAGIPIDEDLIIDVPSDEGATGCAELGALLDRAHDIDALFCSFDQLAAPALRELAVRGIDVPGQIAVAGFDDERTAVLVSPQLTTIRQPYAEMGRKAVDLLLTSIAGETPPAALLELDTELIVRDSTTPTPPSSGLSE